MITGALTGFTSGMTETEFLTDSDSESRFPTDSNR